MCKILSTPILYRLMNRSLMQNMTLRAALRALATPTVESISIDNLGISHVEHKQEPEPGHLRLALLQHHFE